MNTVHTSAAPRLAFKLRALSVPCDPAAAMAFAIATDRQADALLADGRPKQAERLSHAAFEARCRATGARA